MMMSDAISVRPANGAAAPIGVFDSGVGGLSVLRHIHALLPHESLLYFADAAYAPYGAKSEAVLTARALAIAAFLVERGAKALVVACNTATVAAIAALRAAYPAMPIVGVEPGLKPGAAASRNGKVAVLATEAALAAAKFQLLHQQLGQASDAQFLLRGCPGLADQIELGQLDSPALLAMLRGYILPLLDQGADTLVLGCTHYPLVRTAIERIVVEAGAAHVVLVDTGDAVARQLGRLLAAAGLLAPAQPGAAPGAVRGYSSASAAKLQAAFGALLGLEVAVDAVNLEAASAGLAN
ncbi:glutamate racemase [Massilia sp. DWR3-1-1]|uniref:glutamate racemase n=1 Tax=Massilia sp. DWR3-1-1 TaxID=2804559 RepID=UPI003CF7C983